MDDFDENDLESEDYDDYLDDIGLSSQNVSGVCTALAAAWNCVPELPLHLFLERALPSSFSELSDEEIIQLLKEFTHQNQ